MAIVLLGSTSGSCTLQEQAVAGTTTLTLPTFNGTVGLLVSGTSVSASSTSVDFTGLPAGVRRITVMFNGVSTNGTSALLIQIGDSGGIENTGYTSTGGSSSTAASPTSTTSTAGFLLNDGMVAARFNNGVATIVLLDSATNTWCLTFLGNQQTFSAFQMGSGAKALSATLDRVRITTVNGTDTFDAGTINILYE